MQFGVLNALNCMGVQHEQLAAYTGDADPAIFFGGGI